MSLSRRFYLEGDGSLYGPFPLKDGTTITVGATSYRLLWPSAAENRHAGKLTEIVIPRLELHEVPADEALRRIARRAYDLDPDGKGIRIDVSVQDAPAVSLHLENVSVLSALYEIADEANLNVVLEPDRLVIQSKSMPE